MKNLSITQNSPFLVMILFVVLIFAAYPALAATYYVATTGSDSNPGTQSQPFRNIQKAANMVVAGDTVLIRGGTYSQATIQFTRSGTASAKITWKPEPSTGTVTIKHSTGTKLFNTAIIDMFGVSYNRIEGMNFGPSLTDQGIKPFATNSPDHLSVISNARGNQFVGNTFTNIGHDGAGGKAFFGAILMDHASESLVEGNTFNQNYGTTLIDTSGYSNTYRSNTINSMRPAIHYGDSFYPPTAHGIWITWSDIAWTPGSTLRIAGYHTVEDNVIDGTTTVNEASGIRCDVRGHNLTIRRNLVKNLTHNNAAGIFMELGCRNNSIYENIVVNSNRNYNFSSAWISATQYNTVVNNISYGGRQGFALGRVGDSYFANNIAIGASHAQVVVSSLSVGLGGNVFKNNLWWKSATSNIGLWNCTYSTTTDNCFNTSANLTLAQWMAASKDTNSISADPRFVSLTGGAEDFHLQPSSPAIGKGEGGVDMGAYPTSSPTGNTLLAPSNLSVTVK
jgi:Periplasmic copper-binding protein (NosD)